MDTIAIKDEEKKLVKGIVNLICPDAKTYVFGSRANGTSQRSSDLDLVLKAQDQIPYSHIFDIKEMMAASRLPFSVDVMDWQTLSEGFREAIHEDLVEL